MPSHITPGVLATGLIVILAFVALGAIGFGFSGHVHFN